MVIIYGNYSKQKLNTWEIYSNSLLKNGWNHDIFYWDLSFNVGIFFGHETWQDPTNTHDMKNRRM